MEALKSALNCSKHLVVLTGAGVSAGIILKLKY